MLKVTQSCNTAAKGVKAQNLVPCLLEDDVLYINWVFVLLSECITGITSRDFIMVKQTKSGILQHFVIQLLHFFALFIVVVSAWRTEKATCIHRTVPDEGTWTKSGKKERDMTLSLWQVTKWVHYISLIFSFFSFCG